MDSDKSFWNRTNTVFPVFDENFDLSSEQNQYIIFDLCEKLRKSKYVFKESMGDVSCPITWLSNTDTDDYKATTKNDFN